ncbi:MAG: M48 family metalloprotease [Betaproteobacteria bacterium]|nr:M48 family metalloprotease [Betaproteobacteria bacterium]
MSESQEVSTGRKADQEVRKEYGAYDLPTLQQYVTTVGQKLAKMSHRPQLEYHFTVVDSPEINAFALPGGYVYITRGIIAYLNSEAELAAVLGHEIGHVTARHSVQQYSASMATGIGATVLGILVPELGSDLGQNILGLLGNALLSGYGRDHELEADRLGAEYLARAGYDPQAMIRVIGVLKNQEEFDAELARQEGREPRRYHGVFATHPDNDTRLQQVVGEANRYVLAKPAVGRAEFLDRSNGIAFGDSPEQGIVRGSDFLHPGLGFGLRFPKEWKIQNRPDRLAGINPARDAAVELTLIEKPQGAPADFLRRTYRLGFGSELGSTTVNGLPAATAVTTSQKGAPLFLGAVYLGSRAYVLKGMAANSHAFTRNRPDMLATFRSFHPVTDEERKLARPLTLKTVTARAGMTYGELARQSPLGKNAERYLRLINAAYPTGEPAPGQTIKIIE